VIEGPTFRCASSTGRVRGDVLTTSVFSSGELQIKWSENIPTRMIVLNAAAATELATWLLEQVMAGRVKS